MKISLSWLRTFLPFDQKAEEIAAILTGAGLEVESIETYETVPGGLQGLVIGEVLECAKHPDADRLSLTKVSIGNDQPLSIVCGAPNVAAGQKVVVATVGTKLYPQGGEPFVIKKSKIRGQLSEGMICAEDEIGLGNSHAGIMVLPSEVTPGSKASEYFKIERDEILEIGLTPNRGDAASHYGVARDLAALLSFKSGNSNYSPVIPGIQPLPENETQSPVQVEIQDSNGCPRYSGVVIKGVQVKESPAWLQNRLKSIGLRPLNNIVDITNFVLHDLGQPLHAFDLDKIKGNKVVIRRAAEKERFTTLDGIERKLSADDLMICDEKDPMCIAGIFGGAVSGVTESTKSIFLESACFEPSSIRRSSKRHSLKTDASFRFERGSDPEITVTALIRAVNLILEIAGGQVAGKIIDIYPNVLPPYKVAFSYKNCSDLIGKDLDRQKVKNIILSLGIHIDSEGTDGLLLYVPRFKHDVTREADVIEEVLRIYGYDQVEPAKQIHFGASVTTYKSTTDIERHTGNMLQAFGFSEIMALSLNPADWHPHQKDTVQVVNPLSSDLSLLRPSLLPGGLNAISYNVNRQQQDLRFFEFGNTYTLQGGKYTEQRQLSLLVNGEVFQQNPYALKRKTDLAFIRNVLEQLAAGSGIHQLVFEETSDAAFDYVLSVVSGKKPWARLGKVNGELLKKFDLKTPVFAALIDWQTFCEMTSEKKIRYKEIPRFPSVRRDLALLVDSAVKYAEIESLAYSTEKKLLKEVRLFDLYTDEKLRGKKSYAVSFTLQDNNGTLTDKQIDSVMEKLINNYRQKLGAELRG